MIRSLFTQFSLSLICSALPLVAATKKAPNYDAAMAEASKSKQPYAVLIHGKSWHKASQLFLDQLWYSDQLSRAVADPLIITDIHVQQNLSKEDAQEASKNHKGWKHNKISSYPAIQFYDASGSLVKTYQGRALRKLSSVSVLSDHLNGLTKAILKRDTLRQQLEQSRKDKNKQLEAELLSGLIELPINFDKKSLLAQLKAADPEDLTGWHARLSFGDWGYMRHITWLINGNKVDEALQLTENSLKNKGHTPKQRCMILGARGKALAAKGEYVQAWECFKLAKKEDPKGPTGNSIYNYGIRVAMQLSRSDFPLNSPLFGKDLGENITRDHATFSMSSSSHGNPAQHAALFTGSLPPTGFAFHTNAEKNAHIIVDLKAVCTIKALHIMNRSEASTLQRAATLELHISSDQKNWTKVWKAEKAESEWSIALEKSVAARYVKLSLNSLKPEPLHLKAVSVFGVRPK